MCRKIKFISKNTTVPVVKFALDDGAEGFAIIDTGSESTVFDLDFMKNNKSNFDIEVTKDKINIIGMAGENESHIVHGTTVLRFEGASKKMHPVKMKGLAVHLSHLTEHFQEELDEQITVSVIIGGDVLKEIGAKLNFETGEMTYSDYDLPCQYYD